eukprot:2188611-Ditylum_brightwellii.AAC.1
MPIKVRADWDETHPKVLLDDGTMVGRHIKPCCYTNKKVVLHADWEEYVKGEILHVRRGGSKRVWVRKGDRGEDNTWEKDD